MSRACWSFLQHRAPVGNSLVCKAYDKGLVAELLVLRSIQFWGS